MEDSVTVPQNSWLQDAMKKGLILAVVHIFVSLIVYYFVPSKLTGFSYLTFILVFNLTYCFINAKQLRAQVGGYIDFGEVFKYTFVLLVASGIVQTIFSAVFLMIEPAFPDIMAQSQLDTQMYWAQRFGAPDEALEKMNEDFDPEEITKRFTLSGMFVGFGIGLIFYAIGAAIIGLIVRKREPEQF